MPPWFSSVRAGRSQRGVLGPAGFAIVAALGASAACGNDACSEEFMSHTYAFTLEYEGAVSGGSCTIDGTTVRDNGEQLGMNCVPEGEFCMCSGGTLPGDYEVTIYYAFDGTVLDTASVTVTEDPSSVTCRAAERTDRPGDGGAGGAGGAGGVGGASASE